MQSAFAVAAGLICALAGFRHAASLRSDAQLLQRWTEIAERLALLLEEQSAPLPEVLRIAADADTAADELLRQMAGDMSANPLISAAQAFGMRCGSCQQQDTLLRMFSRLGRGSVQARSAACRQSAAFLAQEAAKARIAGEKDARMWRTLGWTGGVCLTLMLI